ncbi:pyridoxal-phosphate-dependent aminotransferase family protein [Sulfurisphaera ohwakuensis]|uniref:Aspartate aminotransferase-like enzyme n=2 Tax=Sulfurisphaera ohwakuensis TaxID=69656 RepID=A0A7J9RU85_SULOH|nr:alanine--glyoxylate aminotransferase family protein [Sulfurisphaera ohwakuensis]MBB5252804.1 aspartate aminotransferase-like enzyme [Sulfurisphaera ohwakuensis]
MIQKEKKLLMHVGPVNILDRVLYAGLKNNVGFTSQEFVEAFQFSLKKTRELFQVDNTYQPFLIPGGGTSAMESVTSLLKEGEKVLVVTNGVFGDRWVNIFRKYPIKVNVLSTEPGYYVEPETIEKEVKKDKYTLVTFTHVETSTGVRQPIKDSVKAVRDYVDLVVVDGVSSVGAEEVKAKDWGVDVYLTASQKALGVPPGLGILVLSERAMERLKDEKSIAGYYLDLRNWLPVMNSMENGKASYFSTPPVHTILMLSEALKIIIDEEGLESRIKRHEKVASAIRAGIEGMGLEIVAKKPEAYSNTVTGVILKKTNAGNVLSEIVSEGVELAPGVHPKLQGKYFRIGHMGWVTENDAIVTIASIERVLSKLGEDIRLGEGIKATQLYLAK